VSYSEDFDADGPLVHAARPVLNELSVDLAVANIGVVLSNNAGQVLDRRAHSSTLRNHLDRIMLAPGAVYAEHVVGTNAIGTALEQGRASVVDGYEHFADRLTSMTCAAHPIVDPRSGRVLGVLDLSCAARDSSPLMSPLVRRAALDIGHRLIASATQVEGALLQAFARDSTHDDIPIVVVSDRTMHTNAAAQSVLHPDDELVFWEFVEPMRRSSPPYEQIVLKNGAFTVLSCDPVVGSGAIIGASVRLAPGRAKEDTAPGGYQATRQTYGWPSLTKAETAVVNFVSQGLTNRKVAEQLFISPYTVDSHLRSIFRKLKWAPASSSRDSPLSTGTNNPPLPKEGRTDFHRTHRETASRVRTRRNTGSRCPRHSFGNAPPAGLSVRPSRPTLEEG
jgi:DNA-binding CsgD family transcriptional regulator